MRTIWTVAILVMLGCLPVTAQGIGPEVTSWVLNLSGATGYGGIRSNVQQVRYSADWVYVDCTSIPSYDIGPWPGNPNNASGQNFVFRITRTPQPNTGAPVNTPLGHIGIWSNGVSIFNARDARSYNNQGVWNQNAIVVEGRGFDDCLGHPNQTGEYHHHLNPRCLYDDTDSSRHAPIIGYAFDGFPIYGAFGHRSADGTGGITRMRSSYRYRSITTRRALPNGDQLQNAQYGPDVSPQYPLGYYAEDFEYIQGLGDLDVHNGRFCVTPEYPNGTYAYFVTIDEDGAAAYPYTPGPTYYGTVPTGNTGPNSGHVTVTEPVQTYTPLSGVDESVHGDPALFPNPAATAVTIDAPRGASRWSVALHDLMGHEVMRLDDVRAAERAIFPLDGLPAGAYLVRLWSAAGTQTMKLVVTRP